MSGILDCAIIGTGPAGLSAALNLKLHGKSFVWLGSPGFSEKVSRAERVMNYPGLPAVTGPELAAAYEKQRADMGLEITERMATSVMPSGTSYMILAGNDFYEAKTLILATGVTQVASLRGESELLGRGVSYCATCDGVLYKGKTIALIMNDERFAPEAKYLAELADWVYLYPQYKGAAPEAENLERGPDIPVGVEGAERVTGLRLRSGYLLDVDGVFILRNAISLSALLPDLETENGHIKVGRGMETSLPGCFAAGDCTGRPYQYAKAVGEGNIAAHSVLGYLG